MKQRSNGKRDGLLLGCALGLAAVACGDAEGSGTLSVLLESEDTITGGLDPGDEVENIRDGWEVRYDKYIVAVGDVEVHSSTNETTRAHDESVFVVDLKTVPSSGLRLWQLSNLDVGRWEFGYATPGAAHGAERHESVTRGDFDEMVDADATYMIAGSATKSDGKSCPPASLAEPGSATADGSNAAGDTCYANPTIAFTFLVTAETLFGPCELDEVPGFAIADGNTTTVAATIHGDHLFFNGFPDGSEDGVLRLAQWLADSDLDLDGQVTQEELETIAPSALSEIDARYQLGGSPIKPLDDMWTYVAAQLKTQGHMNGEGECRIDGMAHEH
jgi:hypothetical protein